MHVFRKITKKRRKKLNFLSNFNVNNTYEYDNKCPCSIEKFVRWKPNQHETVDRDRGERERGET